MSITNRNGTITLTSFAELAEVLDPATLPDYAATSSTEVPTQLTSSQATADSDLATLIAQLASLSGGVETMAREDARAREQATIELARYEALLAERGDAERALAEARRVRAAAEHLAAEAFSDEARTRAAHDVSAARSLELQCIELLAERTRATEEVASRPHLARILAERQRLADHQREAARLADAERADSVTTGVTAVHQALSRDDVDEAHELLQPLAREFPDNVDVRRMVDVVRWRLRNRMVAPAEAALRDISHPPYRDDPEATLTRLADVRTGGLPEDLARRVFGLWSNACFRAVQQRGWQEPRREAPVTSRGTVWARPEKDGPYRVVSSLDEPKWRVGDRVPEHIATRAPVLRDGPTRRRDSVNREA